MKGALYIDGGMRFVEDKYIFWFVMTRKEGADGPVGVSVDGVSYSAEEIPAGEFPLELYDSGAKLNELTHAYEAVLPEEIGPDLDRSKEIAIFDPNAGKVIYKLPKKDRYKLRKCRIHIDSMEMKDNALVVGGWANGMTPGKFELRGDDFKGRGITFKRVRREDIASIYTELPIAALLGFELRIPWERSQSLLPFKLTYVCEGDEEATIVVDKKMLKSFKKPSGIGKAAKSAEKGVKVMNALGPSAVKAKADNKKARETAKENDLKAWAKLNEPSQKDLDQQEKDQESFEKRPKISIVVPLYKTKSKDLSALFRSVDDQTYSEWELVLADAGAAEGDKSTGKRVKKFAAKDDRVKYIKLDSNAGIAQNTNAALEEATGDWIAFMDHDDIISPDALYEIAKVINDEEHPDVDVIYSDQDRIDEKGKRFDPMLKPDFSWDFLRCCNYISHLFAISRPLFEEVGMLDPEFDGAQDYDFILRCCEKAKDIYHIPKLLYHWRSAGNSTADDPGAKAYAFEHGRDALDAHFKRVGIPCTVGTTDNFGKYRSYYHWYEEPLVSVIVPNKDHVKDLANCILSLEERSEYENFEIIIVENNSEEEQTFALYGEFKENYDNIRVVKYEGGFNFSAINNFAVKHARGDYLLFLNNDTEMINGDLIGEMVGYCMRDDVGAVGARLYFDDGSIQHAGVVLGFGKTAGHIFSGQKPGDYGMLGRIVSAQNYSAVTAACMMTKKSLFEELGMFNEELAVAFNDIDYCLKVRKAGYLIVYDPFAEAYHYESKSRGYEDTPEKSERFSREAEKFKEIWKEFLDKPDPYYNVNLSLERVDCSLK